MNIIDPSRPFCIAMIRWLKMSFEYSLTVVEYSPAGLGSEAASPCLFTWERYLVRLSSALLFHSVSLELVLFNSTQSIIVETLILVDVSSNLKKAFFNLIECLTIKYKNRAGHSVLGDQQNFMDWLRFYLLNY